MMSALAPILRDDETQGIGRPAGKTQEQELGDGVVLAITAEDEELMRRRPIVAHLPQRSVGHGRLAIDPLVDPGQKVPAGGRPWGRGGLGPAAVAAA